MISQLSLFDDVFNEGEKPKLISISNGEYLFLPNFFSELESNFYFKKLRKDTFWKQESMKMYGKHILFPRLTAWYGDNDKPYSFSGITLTPNSWTKELLDIKNSIQLIAGVEFNSVLLNLYRDENDSISWHSDAEEELGINPVICSVNFGATRKFQLRHIETKEKIDINLTHGSLLIMKGELQHFWQHQVPKTNQKVAERINLTFRTIR
ncbi:alpha-ketoglutarate-dependent dioxygenase AlkB family protein [Chryseobacterium phocaeense]|uniref:alpha-ketoglutarate-dependent dioxygenase AlkB family protein n=1 Tax=Chryseobacterium phocaeense TaxID=1816690 RepID=UPI0009B9737D|nr:alpha-ketoglutarate-dependent dioxygenase AlkB [Chryseobacterium phocaeense]